MMRPSSLAIALALCVAGPAIHAQPAPQAPSQPQAGGSAAMQVPEVPSAPPAREAPRTIVTEERDRGQVTGATVTRGNNTYHLRPNTQVGSAQPGDAQSSGNRAAQWQIFQFDWQREPEPKKAPAPPAVEPQN